MSYEGVFEETFIAKGSTFCDPYTTRDAAAIIPGRAWTYGDYDHIFTFDEHPTTYTFGGVLLKIIQNTTFRNPATIKGSPYNCNLFGDGTVQHFGVTFPEHAPASVFIQCTPIVPSEESQLQNEDRVGKIK